MSKCQPLFPVLLLFSSLVSTLEAADITVYSFAGGSLTPSSTDPNVTAGNVNLTGSIASIYSLPNPEALVMTSPSGAIDAASAVTNNSFYQFEVTPNAGSTMNLTSLTFDAAAADTPPENGFVVRSSADNYANDLETSVIVAQYPTYENFSASLTGPQFQNLTSAISFRIYSWYVNPVGDGVSAVYDDLKLTGTVVTVPEPSTWAMGLAGIACAGWGTYRRRRAR